MEFHVIIDCHGHYTTAPAAHQRFRDAQIAGIGNPAAAPAKPAQISDDEIRETIETNQLKLQRQRGPYDLLAARFRDGTPHR
jgi:4-oxalmesaconate hydratase